MASSFAAQIPGIIHLIKKLKPASVLDIGKGFGKYGFLIHEYAGIDNKKKIDHSFTLKELSSINIDAVEADESLMLPYLKDIYNNIYFGDVTKIYPALPNYDLILMIDVIEHVYKNDALAVLNYFLKNNCKIIIATPKDFFQQDLYESDFEKHVSHWTKNDFNKLGYLEYQYFDAGAVYLLTVNKTNIRGFGNSFIKKIRRIARSVRNEL